MRGKHAARSQARYNRHADERIATLTEENSELRRRHLELERAAGQTGALLLALQQAEADRDQRASPRVRQLQADLDAANARIRTLERRAKQRTAHWLKFLSEVFKRVSPSAQLAVGECLAEFAARLGVAANVHPSFARQHPDRAASLSKVRSRQRTATQQGRDDVDDEWDRTMKQIVKVTAVEEDEQDATRQ
jgi:hypothetical protein